MRDLIGINILGLVINLVLPKVVIKKNRLLKTLPLIISIITLYIIMWYIIKYNNNSIEYQYREELLGYCIGMDGVTIGLLGLQGLLQPIIMLIISGESSTDLPFTFKGKGSTLLEETIRLENKEKERQRERQGKENKVITIGILIIIIFTSLDLINYYIGFELLLIPIFLIITRYGSKYLYFLPRLEAGLRIFLYTLIGSLFMLIGIIMLIILYGTTSNELLNIKINGTINPNTIIILKIIWVLLFFSFFIKIPIFPLHTWLPLAHSDAPTIGSIILAAILLKLGIFGILRYSLYIFNESYKIYSSFLPIIYILSALSIISSSLIIIRGLFDLKKIIAYTSIIHMNFSIFGLFSKNQLGLIGSSFLMLTHGWISSGLFIIIGLLYYRYHSRFLFYYQGLNITMPLLSTYLLLFTLGNISLPLFSSFLAEFFTLLSTYYYNPWLTLFLLFSLIVSSSAILWFTVRILYGNISPYLNTGYKDLSLNEILVLSPLLFFTLLFTFYPNLIIDQFYLPLTFLTL